MIDQSQSHSAIVSAEDAIRLGLPVEQADSAGTQWQTIWRLWTKYVAFGVWTQFESVGIYEGQTASQVIRTSDLSPSGYQAQPPPLLNLRSPARSRVPG